MLGQSVKLSRLIIFYFISNFLTYAPILPKREPKTSAFRSVFVFGAVFSPSTVVSVAKENVLQTLTIAVFARNRSGADPNFAPFRWHIWLALSEFLCLLANQNVTFVTLFCTQLPFFCTVLPKNCIPRSQSQSRNFFMYIIKTLMRWVQSYKHYIQYTRAVVQVPCEQWFLSRSVRPGENKQPFDFPSSMRVHVTPTSNVKLRHFLLIRGKIYDLCAPGPGSVGVDRKSWVVQRRRVPQSGCSTPIFPLKHR